MRRLSQVIARLDQGGFTQFWMNPTEKKDAGVHDPTLRLRSITPFLALLVLGFVAASVTFIGELVWRFCCCCCDTSAHDGKRTGTVLFRMLSDRLYCRQRNNMTAV